MGTDSTPPPPAPDYTGAAQATAAGNVAAARATAKANRVNQYTPYGSVEYSQPDPTDPDRWNMTQKLSESGQRQFEQNQAINEQLGNLSQKGIGYVGESLEKPMSLDGMYGGKGPANYSNLKKLRTADYSKLQNIGVSDYNGLQNIGVSDFSNLRPGQIQEAASNAAYQNATRYLDPQINQQQSALETQLANQGVQRGSEAYNNAMRDFTAQRNQQYDSARSQAYIQGLAGAEQEFGQRLTKKQAKYAQAMGIRQQQVGESNAKYAQAMGIRQQQVGESNAKYAQRMGIRQQRVGEKNTRFTQGQTARQQQIAEMQMLRQDPLNTLNALRTGQQMNVTQMPGQLQVPGQQGVAGPDYLGGITAGGSFNQGIYNASQAAQANQNAGLYGAGAQVGGALIDRYSDRRLKENIKRIGTHVLGIGLYTWDYLWGEPSSGVIADEVETIMPEAVSTDANGYKMVNYAMLGE